MIKHEVDVANIVWPARCAYCNAPAESEVLMRSRVVEKVGYWVLFVTYSTRVLSIVVPVCGKHKLRAALATKLAERRLFSLFLGVLSLYAIFGAVVDINRLIDDPAAYEFSWAKIIFFYLYALFYWGTFFWARSNAPLLIQDLKGKVYFLFKNDEFGRSFISLNSAQ